MLKWLKKHLIPHEGNDHKPHVLRERSLSLIILFIFVIEAVFLFQIFVVFKKIDFLAEVLPSVLVALTNQSRQENSLPELQTNPLLEEAAKLKAQDMANKGYFAHTSPEGVTPWYWLSQVGYQYSSAGENLAVNFFDSADVAEAWMNSPSHRDNIVNSKYSEIGIATAPGTYKGRNTVFVVQFFANPAIGFNSFATQAPEEIQEETSSDSEVAFSPQQDAQPQPDSETPVQNEEDVLSSESDLEDKSLTGIQEKEGDKEREQENTEAVKKIESIAFTGSAQSGSSDNSFLKTISSPRFTVNAVLVFLSAVILLAILLAVFIKIEVQHPFMLFGAFAVVILIASVLALNSLTFGVQVVELPEDDLNASVIRAF